jgi:hypothetical protein
MAATLLSAIITRIRSKIVAPAATDLYWDDNQILADLNNCIGDLQRAIDDDFQDYFVTIDRTNVTMDGVTGTLTGVPSDVSIIRKIRPRNVSTYPGLIFVKRGYDSDDFEAAMAQTTQDSGSVRVIYYAITGQGAPIGAPTINVRPLVSAQIPLELVYVPRLGAKLVSDVNPIPGSSDLALETWGIAHARGREREDRLPDPGFLKIYAQEKENLLVALTPRDTDKPQIVEGMFEGEENDAWN